MTDPTFTKMPNDLLFDKSLSLGARVLWCALAHISWEQGTNIVGEPITVLPPPQLELARRLGVGVTAMRGYIVELTDEGYLTVMRSNRRKALRYVLSPTPESTGIRGTQTTDSSDSEPIDSSDSVPTSLGIRAVRGGDTIFRGKDLKTDSVLRTSSHARPLDDPPSILLNADRHNVPLDTLLGLCGIDLADTQRVKMAVAYLNGRARRQGIRHLYWIECHRYAEQHPDATSLLVEMSAETTAFADALAHRIERKVQLYRARFPGVEMTPKSLCDWWLRLDARTEQQPVTGDDIRSGRV